MPKELEIPSDQPCELIVILDKSSSMAALWDETLIGLRTLVADYKETAPHAKLTLTLFSDHNTISTPFASVPVSDIDGEFKRDGIFRPSGFTAMFDAICMTIDDAGRRFAGYPKRVRDNLRVVCVIITDGHENDSKKFGMEQVKDRIRKQEQDYSWVFQFLGANIDAIGAAQQIGIVGSRAANFSPTAQGAGQVFRKMSDKARSYGVSGQSVSCEYTAADRNDLMGEQDDGGKLRVPQPVPGPGAWTVQASPGPPTQ